MWFRTRPLLIPLAGIEMTFHTGALSFWMTMVSVADCVGAAIVFGTLTFARIVSTRWAFGNFAAVAGAV